MGEAIIRARGLAKHFFAATSALDLLRGRLRGRRIDALRRVDIEVGYGEILGIVGENGAGKSTLLRLIAGLLVPDGGALEVFGAPIAALSHAYRAQVCYVLAEERSFAWRISGWQNLEFFASLHGYRGPEATRRIGLAIERVGLEKAASRAVREYSTGMRQRLALARGLLGEPQIFLFDEPTRGIDPLHASELRAFVADELLAGRTAIVATHDLQEVAELCERVVALVAGEVRGVGRPQDVPALLGMGEEG